MGQTNQLLEEIRDELRKIQKQEPADEVYAQSFVFNLVYQQPLEQVIHFKKEIQYLFIPYTPRETYIYLGGSDGDNFYIGRVFSAWDGVQFRIPPTSTIFIRLAAGTSTTNFVIWGSSHPIGRLN